MINITEPHWIAAYTKPRNEKRVFDRLVEQEIEAYLPVHKKLKQWSDRKKWVEEPLLRSYIFLRITEKDYYRVLNVHGLVRYISFEGKAVPIPDRQIDTLKMLLGQQIDIDVLDEMMEPGDKVEIIIGSMTGFIGELIRHNGKSKALIRIDHISHGLLVTLPKNFITRSIETD